MTSLFQNRGVDTTTTELELKARACRIRGDRKADIHELCPLLSAPSVFDFQGSGGGRAHTWFSLPDLGGVEVTNSRLAKGTGRSLSHVPKTSRQK